MCLREYIFSVHDLVHFASGGFDHSTLFRSGFAPSFRLLALIIFTLYRSGRAPSFRALVLLLHCLGKVFTALSTVPSNILLSVV